MKQAIEHGADGGNIAEQLSPVLDGTVGSEQRAEALVAAHDDFQQILGGRVRQLPHPKIIDDQQRHGGDRFDVFPARAVDDRVSQFIEQDVGLAIEDAIALPDGGLANGLRQVAFPCAAGAEE